MPANAFMVVAAVMTAAISVTGVVIGAVRTAHARRSRQRRTSLPIWGSPSSGILVGDRWLRGASEGRRSTWHLLSEWLAAQAGHAVLAYSPSGVGELEASALGASWGVVAPPAGALDRVMDASICAADVASIVSESATSLAALRGAGISKLALLGYQNPLSGGRFVDPQGDSRAAMLALKSLNSALREFAHAAGVQFIDLVLT